MEKKFVSMKQPVEEPEKMTKIIVQALEITKQRGIINKGWGGLGNRKFFYIHDMYMDMYIYDAFFFFPFGANIYHALAHFNAHQWKNPRSLCTYWIIALMTGFSPIALLW